MKSVRRRGASRSGSEGVAGNSPTTSADQVPSTRIGASLDELRAEWRRLYRGEAPKLSRDLLVRGIGYRRQEIENGGLGKSTRRKLQTIAKALRSTGRVGPTPSLSLKPGARLVREWHGRTHTVTVTDDGFEYAGKDYSADQDRQKDHWRSLVGPSLLRASGHRHAAPE
jgi:hypothetical protein